MENIRSNAQLFCCPLCRKELSCEGSALVCPNRHSFDLSRRGYVNFAPNAKAGMYDASLFENRAKVMEAGYYDGAVLAITELIKKHVKAAAPLLLDAGCGEGFFTQGLDRLGVVLGIDLSKDAVTLACRRPTNALWAVGDLTRLPLPDSSVDVIVNLLSPANYPEFRRVLRHDGILIKMVPDSDYLKELRTASGQGDYSNESVEELFSKRFHLVERVKVHECLPVPPKLSSSFWRMTPLTAHKKADSEEPVIESITIALELLVGRA